MSTAIRWRRGTTVQHSAFTGLLAEVTYDTDKKTLVVHDGATLGGIPMARADQQTGGSLGYLSETFVADRAVLAADIGKVLIANKATAINSTLPAVAALNSKFPIAYRNIGNGSLTIIPNGAETIDGASTLVLETGASQILVATATGWRTVLAPSLATSIHAATTKAAMADADQLGFWDNVTGLLRNLALTDLISSIFKTTRKIANAAFLTSVRFWDATDNTKGLELDLTTVPTGTTRKFKPWNIGAFAILQDQKASGTVGGNTVANAWTTHTLNTEVADADNIVSISGNLFTPTIDCWADARMFLLGGTGGRLRIYNVTDSAVAFEGENGYGDQAYGGTYNLTGSGKLLAAKQYRLEYYSKAVVTNGLGLACATGAVEIYATVILKGLAA